MTRPDGDRSGTLLPQGLSDLLPPDAEQEARLVHMLGGAFAANGYVRVKPPLVEFEDCLLAGSGAATAADTFRIMDPQSNRLLGLRADMTTQIARLAGTRLAGEARPLRLMYSGQVLRARGRQLAPSRQFTQAGIEIIGASGVEADAEVAVTAVEALAAVGVRDVSLDLGLPELVGAVCADAGVTAAGSDALKSAVAQKDEVGIAQAVTGPAADVLRALLRASGPVERARTVLAGVSPGPKAAALLTALFDTVDRIADGAPQLPLTVDFLETRGFEYHTGVVFSLFARTAARELGRGGRYVIEHAGATPETATGITLFVDDLLDIATPVAARPRIYVPAGTPRTRLHDLQADGYVTVIGYDPEAGDEEKRALGCTHALVNDGIAAL